MLHFLLAATWYWRNPATPLQEEITQARIVQVTRTTPRPVQTTAPKPARTALQRAPKPRRRLTLPQLSSHLGRANAQSTVAAQPTPQPIVATAPPSAGCPRPNANAAIAATPDAAPLTASARASKVSGVAAVDVSLDAMGRVLDTKIAHSSGNIGLDASAIAMARTTSYSPKYVACKAIAGTYTFTVKFVAW